MENNEMLRGIISELIPMEKIDELVREEVRMGVHEALHDYTVERCLQDLVTEYLKDEGLGFIKEIVENIMNSPVKIDDGWGRREHYETFEEFVKQNLRKQCYDQWNVERKIRESVDSRLQKIAKDVVSEKLRNELAEEVYEKLAEEAGKKVK